MWNQLSDIGISRDEPWILTGDFNELMSNTEKLGGATRSNASFWDFRNMAQTYEIQKIRSCGNKLSWGGWRDNVWIQCRLDRSFDNDEWFQLFPRTNVEYMDMWASDHKPIRTCFALEGEEPGKGRFYFDKRMTKKEDFEEVVCRGWCGSNSEVVRVMNRIINCHRAIARWKKSSDINSRDKIVRLQAALEKEIAKAFPDYRQMQRLK